MLPAAPAGRGLTATQRRRRAIGKSLALSGYVEILPTPFLPAGVFELWGLPADDPRRSTTNVLNPLEADRPQLATTLLPALLEALGAQRIPWHSAMSRCLPSRRWCRPTRADARRRADPSRPSAHRRRGRHAGRLFAPATSARRRGADRTARATRSLGSWTCRRSRRCVRGGRESSRAPAALTSPFGRPSTCRGIRAAARRCSSGTMLVGHAGQLHPAVIERSGLPEGTCAVELNLDAIPIVEVLPAPQGFVVPGGVPGRQPGGFRRRPGPDGGGGRA